jgi:hypothetical protein
VGSVVLVADETVAARRGSVELTGPHHIRLAEASVGGFRLLDSAS